jgi:hypothetical protein
MANRMNMLKLLQEVRGFANFTSRRPQARQAGAMLLQLRSIRFKGANGPRRRTLRIIIQDPPDIPHPVKIVHIPVNRDAYPPAESSAPAAREM